MASAATGSVSSSRMEVAGTSSPVGRVRSGQDTSGPAGPTAAAHAAPARSPSPAGAANAPVLDSAPFPFGSAPIGDRARAQRGIPQEGVTAACAATNSCWSSARTSPDDRIQAVIDRTTRQITASGGQIVKVAPWGRRRLAYPIDRHREGSYHIVLFEAPAEAIVELERGLLITEEVLRHLITRVERPVKAAPPRRRRGRSASTDADLPSAEDEEDEDDGASGSTSPRARRLRPRSTERGDRGHVAEQGDDHRQPRARSRDALHAQRPGR